MTTAITKPPVPEIGRLDTALQRIAAQAGAFTDSRQTPRHPVQAPVTLGVFLTAEEDFRPLYRAWAVEISREGMGLLLEHDLPVDARLHVNIEALAGRRCILPVRVAYCRRLLPATCRVGLVFLDPS